MFDNHNARRSGLSAVWLFNQSSLKLGWPCNSVPSWHCFVSGPTQTNQIEHDVSPLLLPWALRIQAFEAAFSDTPRIARGSTVEALLSGHAAGSAGKVKDTFSLLGASAFVLSRLAWGSVMSWLATSADKGIIKLTTWLTYIIQDETPMKMKIGAKRRRRHGAAEAQGVVAAKNDTSTVKVIQSEVLCGFIVEEVATGEFVAVWAEMPTCLQKVVSTTGVSLHRAMSKVLEAPLANAARSRFAHEVHLSTGDRAASNLKMERIFEQERPGIPRLCGLGCEIHRVHTVCGKVFEMGKGMLSGSISTALAQQANGSVQKFRSAIARVLKVSGMTVGKCQLRPS